MSGKNIKVTAGNDVTTTITIGYKTKEFVEKGQILFFWEVLATNLMGITIHYLTHNVLA